MAAKEGARGRYLNYVCIGRGEARDVVETKESGPKQNREGRTANGKKIQECGTIEDFINVSPQRKDGIFSSERGKEK